MELTNANTDNLSLADRVLHGARRGALIGVYLFALIWIEALLTKAADDYVRIAPITSAAILIGGCAIGNALLRALSRQVHNHLAAIGTATLCLFPVVLGFMIAVRGITVATIPRALLASLIGGILFGTMAWRKWQR